MPLIGAAHAAHPAATVTDANYTDDALHARIDGGGPNHGRAAVARAVEAKARVVDLGLQREESQRGLHVGHATVGGKAAARALARAPSLVVEGEDDVAGLVQHARIVRQVKVLDAGVSVAEHDAGALVTRCHSVRKIQIGSEPEALAEERDGPFGHGVTSSTAASARRSCE